MSRQTRNRKLSDRQVERTLEEGVRRGSIEAAKLLKAHRRAQKRLEPEPSDDPWPLPTAPDSPFTALDAADMSRLSLEQQAIARAAHDDPNDPVLIAVAAEAGVLTQIRAGEVSPAELDNLDPDLPGPAALRVRQARWAASQRPESAQA